MAHTKSNILSNSTSVLQSSPIILEMADSLDPLLSPIFDIVAAADFTKVRERFFNLGWAARIGLGKLTPRERESHFLNFAPLVGNLVQPLALRYHGHQFQNYNSQLGDGRGFLFAQVTMTRTELAPMPTPMPTTMPATAATTMPTPTPTTASLTMLTPPRVLDLGTKGSGITPYSRGGDGRLTLKGALREALATEMLESLGVETSKTFSIFETSETLTRHDEPSPTRAAVLTRLSYGHIRFGTFQRLAFTQEHAVIPKLVDYCLKHYYPLESASLSTANSQERTIGLLRAVVRRSADLVAQWMLAGFVHGVLNTDNMNISGESFDYGPYRFLPTYQPEFTAAYFDQSGLYAYGRQPEAVFWNLQQLAAALFAGQESEELATKFGDVLQEFPQLFNLSSIRCFMHRMGLVSENEALNDQLLMSAFQFLGASQIGFEQFFHDLYAQPDRRDFSRSPSASLYSGEEFAHFAATLALFEVDQSALRRRQDKAHATVFDSTRPVTVLIDEIEQIWDLIAKQDDWSLFEKKISEIRAMGQAYGRRI